MLKSFALLFSITVFTCCRSDRSSHLILEDFNKVGNLMIYESKDSSLKAIQILDRIIDDDPNIYRAHWMKIVIFDKIKDYKNALKQIDL